MPYVARFERELWQRLAHKYGAAAEKQKRGRRLQTDAIVTAHAETQSDLSDLQLAWEELVPLLESHREALALYVGASATNTEEDAPLQLNWSTVLQLVDENREEIWRYLCDSRLMRHREVQANLLAPAVAPEPTIDFPLVARFIDEHELDVLAYLRAARLPDTMIAWAQTEAPLQRSRQVQVELLLDWALVQQVRSLHFIPLKHRSQILCIRLLLKCAVLVRVQLCCPLVFSVYRDARVGGAPVSARRRTATCRRSGTSAVPFRGHADATLAAQ